MRKQIEETYCDKCNGKLKIAATAHICVGREPDPSGNGYNADIRDVDLCQNCLDGIIEDIWESGKVYLRGLPNLRHEISISR